jgi:superfamily II DNA or RNA helicase
MLRPLAGREHETCGIYLPLEGQNVGPASFPPPDPQTAGDFIAGGLLRDAARLSLRSSAAPLFCLGRISVRPKPYQLVPLIMALRLDPVRMLIADDVGVGKTIEAGLIARELLDRGEIQRICVLCPPHLCDQWDRELRQKFHIHPVIVRTNTMARLERGLPRKDLSVYQYYPHLVVSIDFAKGDRRRDLFVTHCPDFVIVDEAHTAARPGGHAARDQQLRHELLKTIAEDSTRHLLLLTATPHSGIQESFQSLLGLLKPDFETFDFERLVENQRARLARHFVQRLRGDILRWADEDTHLPTRDPHEDDYALSPPYATLFQDVLAFTRETVAVAGLPRQRQRVRYWAALALLRCLVSSPAAATAALRARIAAVTEEGETEELRQWEILDPLREEGTVDVVPDAAVAEGERDLTDRERRRFREFGRRADEIRAHGADTKLEKAEAIVADLLAKGYHPIVYCRFIETAKYVAEELSARLRSRGPVIHVVAVTSETGSDEEREARVQELAANPHRVLVATDCMSEGINLQDHFDAVVHYDLPWNPNRLEQREGRVDRFGQARDVVPAILLYGRDNPVDLIVLDVLIRKAREIYKITGVRVPVPVDSENVMQALAQALFEEVAARKQPVQLDLEGIPTVDQFHHRWQLYAEREKEHRSRFAQHAIQPDEVALELRAADAILGDPQTVRHFLLEAAQRLPLPAIQARNGHLVAEPTVALKDLAERLGWTKARRLIFESPPPAGLENADVVDRHHPLVTWVSDRILGKALSPKPERLFARSGAAYTAAVKKRTALLLLRLRYRLESRKDQDLFAEEVVTAAFRSTINGPEWMAPESQETLALLQATPVGSIAQAERTQQVDWALHTLEKYEEELAQIARARARGVEEAHERLRRQVGGRRLRVLPHQPDLLGVYVLLPGGAR